MPDPDPAAPVHALVDAMNGGDIDGVMALFDSDPFIRIEPPPPGGKAAYDGRADVRAVLEEFIAMNFEMSIEVIDVEGGTVTTRTTSSHDLTRQLGVAPLTGTETYDIRDGRIHGFTYRFSDHDLERIEAALEELEDEL